MVGCGHYRIVGDSLAHNSQETIFTTRIASFVIKIVKQELEVDDILLQCYDVFTSSIFIKLSDSSSGEDLTPLPFLMRLSKGIL